MTRITDKNAFAMPLSEIAEILMGELCGNDISVNGISTDTRNIREGELFIALTGPNFDGHDYVDAAIEGGAVACIVERDVNSPAYVKVEDTRLAMGHLAKAWRKRFAKKVYAITGSNGKTTVKEMIASIENQRSPVMSTIGNLNNDIGVPLTLFRLSEKYGSAVVEMGANHIGEIQYLTQIGCPDIAVITNAGSAHLEGFGSYDGIAKGKGEIYSGLSEQGIAIINADDKYADYWRSLVKSHKVVTFGLKNNADINAEYIVDITGSRLKVNTPAGELDIKLQLLGEHNVMNALAAIAATYAAGCSLELIKAGLEKMVPVSGRLQMKAGMNNSRIVDDTYNANPSSLKAAINVLHKFPGKRFLALGDMGELGEDTVALHKDAGIYAKQNGVDSLYSVGKQAKNAALEFGDNGFCYDKQQDMIDAIQSELSENVTLLVKGSRSAHMENIVNALSVAEG